MFHLTDLAPMATATSTLAAVITLIVGFRRYDRELAEKNAKALREDLGLFLSEWQAVHQLIKNGSPLLVASVSVVRELQRRFPPTCSLASVLRELDNESPLALSIAITSWTETPVTSLVTDKMTALSLRAQRLQGKLLLFDPLTKLLEGIVRDGYSSMIFFRLLSAGEVLSGALREEWNKPLSEVQNALVCRLQSDASAYFLVRYEKAIEQVLRFAEIAVKTLTGLSDKMLYSLATHPEIILETTATFTGEIRQRLRELQGNIPVDSYKRLETISENIETFASKEFANEEIRKLSSSKRA